MSAALKATLSADDKRKVLTKAIQENDLFTKRDPDEVFEMVSALFDYIRTLTSRKIDGLGKEEFIKRIISGNQSIQNRQAELSACGVDLDRMIGHLSRGLSALDAHLLFTYKQSFKTAGFADTSAKEFIRSNVCVKLRERLDILQECKRAVEVALKRCADMHFSLKDSREAYTIFLTQGDRVL
jgi:hypothetical protein